MNTVFVLMAKYNSPTVPLEQVGKDFLGIENNNVLKRKAGRGEIPFPTFRLGGSKSPYMVSIQDLADWIDNQREQAKRDLETLSA